MYPMSFLIQHINGMMFILYPFAIICATGNSHDSNVFISNLVFRLVDEQDDFHSTMFRCLSADINKGILRQCKKQNFSNCI